MSVKGLSAEDLVVDIKKAEAYLRNIIPKAIPLTGEINTVGTYLLFNTITINNGFTEDVTYNFNCYIAISSPSRSKGLIYDGLSEVLSKLIQAQQQEQQVEVKAAKPFSSNKLIIYQLGIAVTPPIDADIEEQE
ncbi:hypothetical protein TW81_09825 [Vibrio galatheae]|uniref:Uncharacterized protein n=1 Tax=Vibrio galatheae TaxID=579748 RepID=A0A0F4NJL3_9VIBR|nr:hypothetical protein [Vibrio galatheae]KJY83287.1 hypothetical protein TW81_09825 [Vibrio galatheae]